MQNSKIFLDTLQGNQTDKTPIWLMRQAGRYLPEYKKVRAQSGSFLNLCYNPKKAAEVTLQPIHRFGFDASILFADILVIPDALGQLVDFQEGEGPVLDKITTLEGLNKITPDTFDDFHKHLNPVYETLDILKTVLPKETTLIGFAGAPWTVATYMIAGRGKQDFNILAKWANENEEIFTPLMDLLVASTSEYMIKQVEAGAEVLQLFDSWAGALNELDFIKWSLKPAQKIVENIRAIHPSVPLIGFPRGAGKRIPDYVKQTGFTAVSLEHGIDLQWAKENIQSICPVQGCLSPDTLLSGVNLEKKTLEILETFKDGVHIFNLGHGINKETPISHVEELVKIVKNYRR